MTRRLLLPVLGCLLAAAPALAHPGHGDPAFANSWQHYVREPEHLVFLVLLGLGQALLVAGLARRGRGARPAAS
jgi:hydrogenase/urease accessory protein HupE